MYNNKEANRRQFYFFVLKTKTKWLQNGKLTDRCLWCVLNIDRWRVSDAWRTYINTAMTQGFFIYFFILFYVFFRVGDRDAKKRKKENFFKLSKQLQLQKDKKSFLLIFFGNVWQFKWKNNRGKKWQQKYVDNFH